MNIIPSFTILYISTLAVLQICITAIEGPQSNLSDFPLNINTVFIQKDREICPTEVSHTARATLRSKVSNLIQDSIGLIKLRTRVCECGYAGAGWRRVAFLNMTDTNQNCPGEWQTRSSPRRTCQRSINKGCSLAAFSTGEASYSEVCGKLIGYQFGSTECSLWPHTWTPS